MNAFQLRSALALLALTLATIRAPAASDAFALLHSLYNPGTNAQLGTLQGTCVAVDGDFAVVGAPSDDIGGQDSGVVKVYNTASGALIHTLTNPSPAAVDHFGTSVGLSGTRLVIGAQNDDTGAYDAGIAYVYDLSSATPNVPMTILTNPSPAIAEYFGGSVAISGTRIVVGALYENTGAYAAGVAYVYDLDSAVPAAPIITLTNPSPETYDEFGSAVGISGTWVVIGTYFDNTGAPWAGSVYAYDLASGTPTEPAVTLTNPSPATADTFGRAVAIFGTRVVVGTPSDDTGATDTGIAYVFDLASAAPTVPIATLTNPTPSVSDWFGQAVSISGTRALIGAPSYQFGSAYVYDLASATPAVPVLTLSDLSSTESSQFGIAVSISGARVVVGAPRDDTGAGDAGGAYLYDFGSATPSVPVAALNSPSPAAAEYFGIDVAISGSRLVVGAYQNDAGATDAGSVYVYDLASATPRVPILTLTNPSPAANDFFGVAVAVDGQTVVVGAYGDDTGADAAGIAYVYDLVSHTPTVPVVTLTNPSPAQADVLGLAVAVSGTHVVVGVERDDTGAGDAGAAYVYDIVGLTPSVPIATLTNPSPAVSDRFGSAVAISGSLVIIGAYQDDTGTNNAGGAYVYDLASPTPVLPIVTLTNANPATNDFFGWAVAISGTRVVIGAYGDDTGAPDAGIVYVHDLASPTPTLPVATLTNPSPAALDYFGSSVAISGTRIVVGAVQDDVGATNTGSAYLYDLASLTPTVPVAMLTNPDPALNEYFGAAVAISGATIVIGTPNEDNPVPDRGAAYVFGLRPSLNIHPVASGLAVLSWTPTNSPGFVLQYTDSFAPVDWINAPSGTSNPVVLPVVNGSRFYRLVHP